MLDFSKAFDRIDFNILKQILINMRVHPILINWIANFLTDRSQRTRIGSNFSSWRTTNGVVPQDTKLDPLLFLIMVNDLNVSDDTVKFVDDTTILEIVLKGQESNSVLPSQITESTKWASENNMKLNPTKTKEVRVGFSPLPGALPPITFDGHDIVVVPHAKLLGVMISKDLKWIEHADYICKKASKRLYALRLLKRVSIPAGKLVRVYTTCVRPILEFSCEVIWLLLGWCHCSCGERPFARNFSFKCVMKHPINSILSFPQDIKQDILYVMIIVFQYQSIGQVGLLIWPVVRPTTLV
jgi:hypothetical protein